MSKSAGKKKCFRYRRNNVSNNGFGICFSSESSSYPWRVYSDAALNYNDDDRHGQLKVLGWYSDLWGEFQNAANSGFLNRRLEFATQATAAEVTTVTYTGEPVTYFSRIMTNFTSCPLPMMSAVEVRVEMELAPPSFYMQCFDNNADAKGYYLKIESTELRCKVTSMNFGLTMDLEKHLETRPQPYHLRRIEVRKIGIPAGNSSLQCVDLKQSSVNPDR